MSQRLPCFKHGVEFQHQLFRTPKICYQNFTSDHIIPQIQCCTESPNKMHSQ
jgi:hypothetical protein